jgi:hypothetical protein
MFSGRANLDPAPFIGEGAACMSSRWIYILGERAGADVKIGTTAASTVATRLDTVNGEQTTNESYVCLAAVCGSGKDERALQRAFGHLHKRKGLKQEYFYPDPELVEYAAWLRSQWFSSPNGTDAREGWAVVEPEAWMPDGNGRRIPEPEVDPTKLIQDYEDLESPLAGTPWSWFPNPKASIQDYFTPPEIVNAAREGMGAIDLDAASHWLANREHKIPRYFHIGYSAFEHDWEGCVWLNPPYGDNERWWSRALDFIETGQVEQICILSPVWAFTTQIAQPLMARSTAMTLLSPTPKFWGNSANREGSNMPHAIVYIGHRPAEVLRAFGAFGVPFRFVSVNDVALEAAA